MAMTICYNCQQPVSTEARVCPHCGQKLKSRGPVVVLGCGGLLFVVLLLFYIASKNETSERVAKMHDPFGDGGDAAFACQAYMRATLKAPSSAQFPNAYSTPAKAAIGGGAKWVYASYVDAQNAFGAMLRSHYACEVQKDPSADRYTLISIIPAK